MLSKLIRRKQSFPVVFIQQCMRSSVLNPSRTNDEVRFDSITTAYGYKSKYELYRGWAVFKLCSYTSLVNRLTQLLNVSRTILGQYVFESIMRSTLYGHFVAGTDKSELKPIVERLSQHGVRLILDYSMESDVATDHQVTTVQSNHNIYDENLLKSLKNVQTASELSGPAAITAIKFTAFISPDVLEKLNQVVEQNPSDQQSLFELASKSSLISKHELIETEHLIQRINRIVQEVKQHQGRVFIDAEQSYFQTAIHKLVLELQELYNRDRIIVYNTYQCYRKITLETIRNDLARAKAKGFSIGFKLVRGAYMDQERKRAVQLNTNDPIHPNFAATTQCYHQVFKEVLDNAKTHPNQFHVFVASHNEDTVKFALRTMDEMNVKRNDGLVAFATLFGMCDYLTFPLAAVGYDAYKLAPYGPIDRLLPYLTRRAQENRAIFAKAEKDRQLHYKALRERN
ncbi:unnamed protein product [Adineta ricciae]|uniref:Proline dehydrogenase n=1 Tax=Adineta ricciae TaxID=249248 RepID=A0A815XJU7_ADIRI|nr:unnamed protein product [Adineta ricciae]CAF1558675.1 unnamed protein product [Adineta ricciae]